MLTYLTYGNSKTIFNVLFISDVCFIQCKETETGNKFPAMSISNRPS